MGTRERFPLKRCAIRTGSAKQRAEKPSRATRSRIIFRKAKGWILIRTILVMVFSSGCATSTARTGRHLYRPALLAPR
jgi:hypothetical protein